MANFVVWCDDDQLMNDTCHIRMLAQGCKQEWQQRMALLIVSGGEENRCHCSSRPWLRTAPPLTRIHKTEAATTSAAKASELH